MNKNVLLSAQGSFLVGVDVDRANEYDIIDLIRAKKMASGIEESAPRLDFDGDGDVDGTDVQTVREILLGLRNPIEEV